MQLALREGWSPSEPVHIWVLCADGPETGDCIDPARWIGLLDESVRAGSPLENARVVPHADVTREDTGWRSATRDATSRHGVASDPRAMVVAWPADPSRE